MSYIRTGGLLTYVSLPACGRDHNLLLMKFAINFKINILDLTPGVLMEL